MQVRKVVLSFLLVAVLSLSALAADTFQLDPAHSTVVFRVRHMGVAYINGRIEKIEGQVVVDDANPANSRVEIRMDATTINTGVGRRDEHLKSPDFFNAAQFPTLSFKSTKVRKTGEGRYEVTGELSIRGVTRPLTVTVEKIGEADLGRMGYRAGFSTRFTVKRSEFGVSYMPEGLGEEVQVTLDIEVVRQ